MVVNKRQHKRFSKRCELDITENDAPFKGFSRNFSLAGLCVETRRVLLPDTFVNIIVRLPDGSNSRLIGKVVRRPEKTRLRKSADKRIVPHEMGVEILKKDPSYLHFIRSLIATSPRN